MKKIFLFIGVGVATLLTSCASKDGSTMVDIPDANFKAYLLKNFDENKDGNISLSEAKRAKTIDCSGLEIKRLDGIEKFENLESLNCSNNQLDELELRYNRKLNKLICTGNNAGMFLYIGMSSPLRNAAVQKPTDNSTPQDLSSATQLLDGNKCTYDVDKTSISLSLAD